MTTIKQRLLAAFLLLLFICALSEAHPVHADSGGYLLPDSSTAYITTDQVSDWPSQALCYARQEIYARRGMIFQSQELQGYFSTQSWYQGLWSADQIDDSMLNTYELSNAQTLLDLERDRGMYVLDMPGYSYDALSPYTGKEGEAEDPGPAGGGSRMDGAGTGTTESISDAFTVDLSSYIFPDSDERVLTPSEISQLTLQELCYARYEIYARHGYLFSSTELSDYFNAKNWYWGTTDPSVFSDSMLNYAEAQNRDSLQAQETALGGYVTDQPGYTYSKIRTFPAQDQTTITESDYIFYESAIRYLTDQDVAGMSLRDLCYAKNEIYARRGYIFQSQELRDYFSSKPWYLPTISEEDFSESVFSEIETANIALLKQYEYAVNPNGYQLY